MSIEDINYLKEKSIKQSYTFLVDSSSRDRRIHPFPSEYTIDFETPFRYVIGMELMDASIPKTMYNIDNNNNKLVFYIGDDETDNTITPILDKDGNYIYDSSKFKTIEISPGDYTSKSFIEKIRSVLNNNMHDMNIFAVNNPIELTNKIYFRSSKPFILDMKQSTMAEVLGFDLHTSNDPDNATKYSYKDTYNNLKGLEKLYHSIQQEENVHVLYSPGMMYLLGYKYLVLKCPDIEQHLYRSQSYSKYNLGLAKIRINGYGYNDEKTSFTKVPLREFHPIGKLSRLRFRFETNTGQLYDFKGVNHNMTFVIYYYEPTQVNIVKNSTLNPEYKPNFLEYMYKQEDREGDTDDDEDELSRDNLEIYKKRESEYNSKGIENKNQKLSYVTGVRENNHRKQMQYLQDKLSMSVKMSDTEESEYETESE
jgi:hypothetical protein